MALTISNESKQKFEGVNIQPPDYIWIRFIEEWELSDSDILHFDYQRRGGILPKWGPGEKLMKKSLLFIGATIKIHLLYQINMITPICPNPNDCEWIRVGRIEIVT